MTKPLALGEDADRQKISEESVKEEVRKFSSKMETLKLLTTAGLAVPALFAFLGPAAFVSTAAVGLAASAALKRYSTTKKEELDEEIKVLQETGRISSDEAAKLKSKIHAIYTDELKDEPSPPA